MTLTSSTLMTVFDLAGLMCVGYACIVVIRNRKIASELELTIPLFAVLTGLWVIAGLFAADLIVMHVVSRVTSPAWAMAFLAELFLDWGWAAALTGVVFITAGLAQALRRMPRIRLMLHSLSHANLALEREHAARVELESQLRQGERSHAYALRKRAMELRAANERLHKEIAIHRMTARSLRESEARFRSLSEGSIQGIIVINTDWKVLFVNKAFANLLGYHSPEEVKETLRFESFYAPHEFERMTRYREARMRGEPVPTTYEVDVLKADGSVITIHNTLQVANWNGEAAKQFTVIDVSDRKRAERELRQSERRYRGLIEDAVQGIAIHEARKPIFANQAYADILGYESPEDILAIGDMEKIYAPSEHARLRAYQRARKEGRPAPSQYEFQAVRKDGSIAVLQNVVKMVEWDGKKVTQHNIIDITERKRAEEALRTSEQRYRELVEGSVQGILVMHDFVPLFANDAYAHLLGFPSAAELVRHGTLQDRYPPHERKRITGYWNARMAGKPVPDEYEVDMLHTNGAVITVHNVLRNITWEGKTAVQIAAIDVTARRKTEQDNTLLVRDLKERVKELTMLRQLSSILQKPGHSPSVLCTSTVESLKRSFMHADVTEVRIMFDGIEAKTGGWRKTSWCLQRNFSTRDGRSGQIQVCYLEARPEADDGPFLIEEINLLKSVVAMLCTYFEREHAQAEADKSRQLLDTALPRLNQVVLVVDSEFRKIAVCKGAVDRIFGFGADEVLVKPLESLFESNRSFNEFIEDLESKLNRGEEFESEYPLKRNDGGRVLGEITACRLSGDGANNEEALIMIRDVTARASLKDGLQRYRTVVSASRDRMYFVDRNYIYRLANSAAAAWHARPAEEIVACAVSDLYGKGRFQSVFRPLLERCFSGETVEHRCALEYQGRKRCETALLFEPCHDESGSVVGAAVIERDVSADRTTDDSAPASGPVVVPMNAPRR